MFKSIASLKALGLLLVLAGLPAAAGAKQVNLDVALGTPVLTAGKKQSAFLKISLVGFEEIDRRAPVNVAIVLDKSGSMSGDKIERAKEAAIMALNRLSPEDTVSVVTYDSVVNVILPAQHVTDRSYIQNRIRNIAAGGNTALFAGVSKGAQQLRQYLEATRVNRLILLSDGLANVGPSTPSELGQLGASLGREGISVTTIGLGAGYNEDLMTQLSGFSDGNHYFARTASDLVSIFNNEFSNVLSVIAKDVTVIIHCNSGIRPLRVLGRDYEILGQDVRVDLNQLSSRQEKFVMLELEVPEGRAGQRLDVASVDVNYLNLNTQRTDALQGAAAVSFTGTPEEAKRATNKKVMESAVEQLSNEMSKDALRLMDEGRAQAARQKAQETVDFLQKSAREYNSPYIGGLKSEAEEDAAGFSAAAPEPGRPQSPAEMQEWNLKRKELRERQYKRDTQQQY